MAARTLRPRHQEDVKAKIQATQLVNLLQNHALKNAKCSQTQIRAAEALLARAIPTLSATELTTINDDEKLDDNQLLAMLADLIEQHPDLVQQALAAKARKDSDRTAPSLITTVNVDSKTA